jgi:hypothetical protein
MSIKLKREILTFCNKLSARLGRVKIKFLSDMIYGMITSRSVILSDVADALKELVKKKNTLDRLSRQLSCGIIPKVHRDYLNTIKPLIPDEPVVLVDDTDIVKPYGRKFDSLGTVKDASAMKASFEKGYRCTEMTTLSNADSQPISCSHICIRHKRRITNPQMSLRTKA